MLKEDLPAAAAICQNAFNSFNESVGLAPEFPPAEIVDVPNFLLGQAFTDGFEGFVAVNSDGEIVGSNLVELRDEIAGIGPISVATGGQNAGAGRLLMQACMQAAAKRGMRTVRLHQIGSNAKSFSLYLDLGFTPLLTCGQYEGCCTAKAPAGFTCEPLSAGVVEACSALHRRACGVHRRRDIAAMIGSPHPNCVVFDASTREVVAYTTGSFLCGHTVAASDDAFKALVVFQSQAIQAQQSAGAPLPPTTMFVPHAYPHLLRWLSKNGFRLNRQIVQMGYGAEDVNPSGILRYFPAIQY
jgi:GNAT superfamily N-acetyltransferase